MRIEHVACLLVAFLHGGSNLVVAISSSRYVVADFGMRRLVKVEYACKVAWVAHVHSVSYSLNTCLWRINARKQIVVEDVVGIVGCNKMLYWQSHALRKESGCDIAEVATWHTDSQVVCFAQLLSLCIGIEIIECLRQEACHVDRIGRSKVHVTLQLFIHKRTLHQSLAVVEHSIHLNGCDVFAKSCKLALLNLAHFSLRIEHIDMYAINTKETVGYGRTCVARCCYEHVDLLFAFALNEIAKQASHEACANILEGEGRAMEEFKRIDVVFHLYDRSFESQSVEYDFA